MSFSPHTVCSAVKDNAVSQSSFPETFGHQEWQTWLLSRGMCEQVYGLAVLGQAGELRLWKRLACEG